MKKDLDQSSGWSKDGGCVTMTRINRIRPDKTDPRIWPLNLRYEGGYDPVGNGEWEFEGELETNAVGGFEVLQHKVVSGSFSDFLKLQEKEAGRRGKTSSQVRGRFYDTSSGQKPALTRCRRRGCPN